MLVVTACRGKRIVPLYPSSDTSQPASEHVPNRYMSMFYSRMISGLERWLVKMIKINQLRRVRLQGYEPSLAVAWPQEAA
jgi:hypothetical protein